MEKLTGYNLITFINQLPKNQSYNYINPRNKGLIKILDVSLPDGPITFKRWNPSKCQSIDMVNAETISSDMIWRFANALSYKQPVNVDRIFGGSYNTRSVLEALVAHTPQFYFCYPGRIMEKNGSSTIEHGHKHLLWYPSSPHINGRIQEIKTEITISEVPGSVAVYDSLVLPDIGKYNKNDHEILRRHSQIQISLYLIGLQLGYRTWIAQNDNRIVYHDKPLIEHEGIISSLQMENMVASFPGAVKAGKYIDCIWFKNCRLMPAVMEVEHTTGILSGLDRMLNFSKKIPPVKTRYVIAAPDHDRDKVIDIANREMYKDLDTRYFPYSSVEELYSICQRRKLKGITEEFLDCYMEPVVVH